MDVVLNKFFKEEVIILANLYYSNLITYYFAMKGNTNESSKTFEIIVKKDYLYIGIELMKINLNDMLQKEEQLSYAFLIDIIYQIAKRMCYLHNMYIMHHDLKSDNILVNIMETKIVNKVIQHTIVKVIDFGISKIEVGSNLETTKNKFLYSTIIYLAHEYVLRRKKDPFYGVYEMKEILERIKKSEKPNLSSNYNNLKELI
uniref:Protein kinase domain-containing protein n=1 Tax=Physcomitrium patens TaxID=3218 RepID=A0A7I4DCW8_PHYPA